AGREQLRELGDDTRAAIAQAKGLIAFASQAARMHRRRPDSGEDSEFRALQQSVQESAQGLDGTPNHALASLQSGGDAGALCIAQTSVLAVQVTTEVTVTANIVI